MSSPVIMNPSFSSMIMVERAPGLPSNEQRELHISMCQKGNDLLPGLAEDLTNLVNSSADLSDAEALASLRQGMTAAYLRLAEYDDELRITLGIEESDPDLCAKRLEQCRLALAITEQDLHSAKAEIRELQATIVHYEGTIANNLEQCRLALARAEQELHSAEGKNRGLRATIVDYEGTIANNRARIDTLQARTNALEAQLKEMEQRSAVEPDRLGTALGQAVDAIQQALTSLNNPHIDYGLQEFDLQTHVNLQLNENGQLLIRFPGINENIAAQNLSNLQMRLRPIPKSQQASR